VTRAATVLVVDDSAIDRRLAGRLLEQAGFAVVYASDGEEALATIAASIVVTDLHMPKLNGLELVEAVRKKHPKLPVVLMTAHGSEDIAMHALRTGAASFVPKRRLADELAATLEAIVELAIDSKDRTSNVDPLDARETRFQLDNDLAGITEIVGQLEAELSRLGLCDETGLIQVGVALREAMVNAIVHGNLEVSSKLLDDTAGSGTAFADLVAERRQKDPWQRRRVSVSARYEPDEANLERLHGRGLMLMRMFMDEVVHSPTGNVVTMTKRRAR
jgi:CheY-like chemotaxis protein/anti-sigma regulatory factor (Ser/Thr protein kinase)